MKKQILSLLLALCVLAALVPNATAAGTAFKDVKPGAWYYEPVQFMNAKGLMYGSGSADTFKPNETTTRGMMVTVLYRLAGEPETATASNFQDVKGTEYYGPAVKWAAANSIVAGYGDVFKPNDKITREQMALILYQYALYCGYDTSPSADLSVFPDGGKTSKWAKDAVSWANAMGIINGKENKNAPNTLEPGGNATRAEIATVFYTFVQKTETTEHTVYFNIVVPKDPDETPLPDGYVGFKQVKVAHGKTVEPPEPPVYDGYAFDGWYEGNLGDTPFDFSTPITQDITLDGYYSKLVHTATFDLNYPDAPTLELRIELPGQPPADPVREGYLFQGWFTAPEGGEKYAFDQAADRDVVLYAHWAEAATHEIIFDLNYPGAGEYRSEEVAEGELCPEPSEPNRADYVFEGWYTGKEDGDKFDFTAPVTADIKLYAHWTYDGIPYATPYRVDGNVTQYDNDPQKAFFMMGNKFIQGFTSTAYISGNEGSALYGLYKEYDLVTFDVGHLDNQEKEDPATLHIIADGGEVCTIELTKNMPTVHCAVNVKGVDQLQIVRRGGTGYGYGVGNVIRYRTEELEKYGETVPESYTVETVYKSNLSAGRVLPYQHTGPSIVVYRDDPDRLISFSMMGQTFYQGVTTGAYIASTPSEYLFNLGGSFEEISFVVGHVDSKETAQDSTLYVYMDGVAKPEYTIELSNNMPNQTYTLNVQGVNQLRLYREGGYRYDYGVANIDLR